MLNGKPLAAARWLSVLAALLVVAQCASPPTPPVDQHHFPMRDSAGLPAGWVPERQVTGDLRISEADAVVEDVRLINGDILIEAPNVTLRRIQGVGARVTNDQGGSCHNGLVIEDSEFTPSGPTSDTDSPVIGLGGYTARNVVIDGHPEGLRAGGRDDGCGPVTVENSFIRVTSPDRCADWHGDGIQGHYANALTVRNTTIFLEERADCGGTAPFFYPSGQGNTSVDIDGLLLSGGGYSFRNGMPGTVRNLNVVDGTWGFGPVDVKCSVLSAWEAKAVTLDPSGQTIPVRPITCAGSA